MTKDGPPTRHLHPVEPPYDPEYDTLARPPSHDPDAERALLHALLDNPDAAGTLATELEPSDFYRPEHETIWATWHQLHTRDGVPPDTVTLNAALITTRDQPAIRALVDIMVTPATPQLLDQYVRLIRNHARIRAAQTAHNTLGVQLAKADPDNLDQVFGDALDTIEHAALRFGPTTRANTTGFKDLSWLLGGVPPTQPPPAHARRTDGTALFYAGKVNGLIGDPESAKTWLAQIAGVEALNDGGTFAMIDVDHNGPDHTAARLVLLGARMEHLADPNRFRYYEPEEGEELTAAVTEIITFAPTILIVDSIGEVFPMLGVNTNDSDEITSALRLVCSKPANTGTCVITIDHLPKSQDARATGFAIGSIAKKRMIRGSYLRVDAKVKPVPGGKGVISLRIEKDTSGELRRSSGGGYAGTLTLDSTDPSYTTWSISREDIPKNDDGTARRTTLMEKVSRYIEGNDQASFNDINNAIGTKREWVKDVTNLLVIEGFVARFKGPRNSQLHHSIAPYRQTEDDHVTTPE